MPDSSPVSRFEQAWSENTSPPDVFSFLKNANVATNRQRADILLCDQYQRWKTGIAIPVEKYFEAFPELDDEELKLELIAEEFGYEEKANGAPDAKEFVARFPFLSDTARNELLDSISSNESLSQATERESLRRAVLQRRPEKIPEKISRFKILDVIGRGAFGVVYKGRDEELERMVAIKVPNRTRVEHAGGADAFLKEARVVARLDHPSIVPVYDVGTLDGGNCYLVSKFIDGVDLKTKIPDRYSFVAAGRLCATIARALHHAHRQGLVHRDVKPANILIDKSGSPHVVDFGLALRDEDFGQGSSLVGTPAYMSPEQALGKGDRVDARSDIYSLGVVLFELLTANKPYRKDSATDIIEQIKRGEVRPPRQLDDSIPQELDRICMKAMSRQPRDRYSTALDFAIDLEAFIESSDAAGGPRLTASDTVPVSMDASRRNSMDSSIGSGRDHSLSADSRGHSISSQSAPQSVESGSKLMPVAAILLSLVAIATAIAMAFPFGSTDGKNTDSSAAADFRADRHIRSEEEVPSGSLSKDEVAQLQLEAAQNLKVAAELRLADRMVLKLIPAGSFQMGSSRDEIDLLPLEDWFFKRWQRERMYHEAPRHVVRISQPFYMSIHEVTIGQFRRFVNSTDYETTAEKDTEGGYGWKDGIWVQDPRFNWTDIGFEQDDNHPVCNVSWDDAVAYCQWLSREENATFRLPTEAEWEYACRAGTTTWFHNGDRDEGLKLIANIADQSLSASYKTVTWERPWNDGYPHSAPVGSFQPNALGLFDMHGNAWEWCSDWYGQKYYSESSAVDPVGPDLDDLVFTAAEEQAADIEELVAKVEKSGDERDRKRLKRLQNADPAKHYHVFRGGGWDNYPGFCRSADRYSSHSPKIRTQWAGFRVVKEIAE